MLHVLLGAGGRDGAGLTPEVLGLARGQVVPDRGDRVDPRIHRGLEGARPDLVPAVVRVEQVAVAVEEGPTEPDALRDDVERRHGQPEFGGDTVHDLVRHGDLALAVGHEHARELGDDRVRGHGAVDRADVPLELVRVEVRDVVRPDRHRADVRGVLPQFRELVLLRTPRRRARDAEVHHPHRHARPVPDAAGQEADVPAPRSGGADALRSGVADREVRQLPLVLQALPPPVRMYGEHVDHALGRSSLPRIPARAPNAPPPTTASPPMTEVSRATRVRVFMPETVRGLAHPGLWRSTPVDGRWDGAGGAGEPPWWS